MLEVQFDVADPMPGGSGPAKDLDRSCWECWVPETDYSEHSEWEKGIQKSAVCRISHQRVFDRSHGGELGLT